MNCFFLNAFLVYIIEGGKCFFLLNRVLERRERKIILLDVVMVANSTVN